MTTGLKIRLSKVMTLGNRLDTPVQPQAGKDIAMGPRLPPEVQMKKFYLVFSEFYDTGVVKAAIVRELEAAEKPKDTFKSLPKLDVYGTWYANKEEAGAAVIEARKQSSRKQA